MIVILISTLIPDLTNDDLKCLDSLPHLRKLYVAGGKVDGNGLKHLRNLAKLEQLSLGIPLTDDDLRHLIPLQSMQELFLMGPSDTNSYVSYLRGPTLIYDDKVFYDSGVTSTGIDDFSTQFPNCLITY